MIDWGDLETMRTTKPNLQRYVYPSTPTSIHRTHPPTHPPRYLIQDMVSMNPESASLLKAVAMENGQGSVAGAT